MKTEWHGTDVMLRRADDKLGFFKTQVNRLHFIATRITVYEAVKPKILGLKIEQSAYIIMHRLCIFYVSVLLLCLDRHPENFIDRHEAHQDILLSLENLLNREMYVILTTSLFGIFRRGDLTTVHLILICVSDG